MRGPRGLMMMALTTGEGRAAFARRIALPLDPLSHCGHGPVAGRFCSGGEQPVQSSNRK
jgi:hypothetical protein